MVAIMCVGVMVLGFGEDTDGGDGGREPVSGWVLVGEWRRWVGCVLTLVAVVAGVWWITPAEETRAAQAVRSEIRATSDQLRSDELMERFGEGAEEERVMGVDLEVEREAGTPEAVRVAAREAIEGLPWLRSGGGAGAPSLEVRAGMAAGEFSVRYRWVGVDGDNEESLGEIEGELEGRVPGGMALLPPVVAVVIALWFRQLVVALALAVWGGGIAYTGEFWRGTQRAAVDYAWGSVSDSFNLSILLFTFCLVGMVHIIIRMGGIAGVLKRLSFLARSARSTRVATALMGLALFFDDYANTVVVGTTMRPLTDRQKISREKLAYLVDSTSAPIAGLAVISTWIGFEVGLFDELSRQLSLGMSGYEIFFSALPMRFYCIFTLVFVGMIAWSGRGYGPMFEADRRAWRTGEVRPPSQTGRRAEGESEAGADLMSAKGEIPHRWPNAVIPVAMVIAGTLVGMVWSGWSSGAYPGGIPSLFELVGGTATVGEFGSAVGAAVGDLGSFVVWREAFSQANNATVLLYASLVGTAVAAALAVGQRLLTMWETVHAFSQAIPLMATAAAILVLAWSIQGVCADLGTGVYLVSTVRETLSVTAVPLITFGLAGVVAFSTGTSWGTMGILLPAMVPLAYQLAPAGEMLAVIMTFGAVLDGAIFGDHCSPISDTTVMSSMAASVDHLEHVRTQIPYALTTMAVSAGCGYLPVAMGMPVWVAYGVGVAVLGVGLGVIGGSEDCRSG